MGTKEVEQLKPDEKVYHKHYGISTVVELMPDCNAELFGVILKPDTLAGQLLLMHHSRMPQGTPILETSYRLILCKVVEENGYLHIKIKK